MTKKADPAGTISLLNALGWIMWRGSDAAKASEISTLMDLTVSPAYTSEKPQMLIEAAQDELWQKLGAGQIKASAINTSGQVVIIPAKDWPYLEPADPDGEVILTFKHDYKKTAYTKIFISRTELETLWRPQPWEPPANLNIELASQLLTAPRLWLAEVLKVMAFAEITAPENVDKPDIRVILASMTLLAAAKDGRITLVGAGGGQAGASDPIPQNYFDFPRALGTADNTIEPDLERVSMDGSFDAREGLHQKWRNVQVERKSFLVWFESALSNFRKSVKSESGPVDSSNHSKAKPPMQAQILNIASELWPDGKYPARVGDRDKQILARWPQGETRPHQITFRRAFNSNKTEQ